VLHDEHRLVAALLGAAAFAALASRYFVQEPPRGPRLASAVTGLARFVEATVPERGVALADGGPWLPRRALLEAIAVDVAYQRVLGVGLQPPLRVSADELVGLPHAQLVASPALAIIDEHWPLVALRRQLVPDPGVAAVLPRAHPSCRTWVIAGKSRGVRALPLVALHARLLRALASHPVGAALDLVAASCDPRASDELARNAQGWIARSLELGMWCALTHADRALTHADRAASCAEAGSRLAGTG